MPWSPVATAICAECSSSAPTISVATTKTPVTPYATALSMRITRMYGARSQPFSRSQ